jgi:hypothetical protein
VQALYFAAEGAGVVIVDVEVKKAGWVQEED